MTFLASDTCQYPECSLPVRTGRPFCHGHTAVAFIEGYCTHIKGKWAGQPFKLIPWQQELLLKLFGTVNEAGKRKYRTCYCEVGKKNGKSELASAIALFGLVGDDEAGSEVYSAAGDRDQASLVYYPAAQMVRNDKRLDGRLKVVDSRRRIVDYQKGSFYQVLSAETFTKHGLNPHLVIFDELHAQPSRDLWDVLTEGTGIAREQQLIFVITTAGVADKKSIGWEVHEYARQVRDGIIEDPTFLPVIYGADPEKDDWENEETWKKANPSFGHIFGIENLREHYLEVKNNPARQNNFKRFRLNLWVQQISRWLPMDAWDTCADPIDLEDLRGRVCYGGLDLSSSVDLTAFALLFPPDNGGKWRVLMQFFIPGDNVLSRVRRDGVPYDIWAREGLITLTPGEVVDYSFVRKRVNEAASLYDLREVAFDPWGAVKLATELQEQDGITMVAFRQGYLSLSPPTKQLYNLVLARQLAHGGNKLLRWNADNLVVVMDAAENVKPDKSKAKERIDGIVALIMALGRATVASPAQKSYNKRAQKLEEVEKSLADLTARIAAELRKPTPEEETMMSALREEISALEESFR